ncbi:serine hydrolase [Pedobacter foliorum]|uniref:serine hydrolase n=1 Tax=Pedobacter foliorum TaxID=2739058 RepID=UPI0015674945|nr:serine hydrolase [Pedobacter foliorum]NRF40708.1 serine hydrolase [Pedobacter foliorum]
MKRYFLTLLFLTYTLFPAIAQPANTPELSAKLDSFLNNANRFSQFNGSVLVSYKGKIILNKGYGFKDFATNSMNDQYTIFRIGSITKTFTATLILMLEEQGKLSLQDKLSKYFPDFPSGEKLTIQHLLNHSSGLYDYASNMDRADSAITDHPVAKDKILAQFIDQPLAFTPGSKYHYTNSGYYLLGLITEKVTGKPWEQAIRENILNPLQMTHSGFDFRALKSKDKPIGYQIFNEIEQMPDVVWDSTVTYAAGGLYTTSADMLAWAKAVTEQKLLSKVGWRKAFTVQIGKYGNGWDVDSLSGVRFVGHNGGFPGFSAHLLIFPEDDLQVIVLSNVSDNTYVTPISKALASMVLKKPIPGGLAIIPKNFNLPQKALETFAGNYQFDKKHQAQVFLTNGKLFIKADSNQLPVTRILPLSNNTFFLSSVFITIGLNFEKDKAGKVTNMIMTKDGNSFNWKRQL